MLSEVLVPQIIPKNTSYSGSQTDASIGAANAQPHNHGEGHRAVTDAAHGTDDLAVGDLDGQEPETQHLHNDDVSFLTTT